MTATNRKVVRLRGNEAETAQDVAAKIAEARRDLRLAKRRLQDLQGELDAGLLRGAEVDGLATKVAMEERRIAALSREIERLERDDLPRAAAADAATVRESVFEAASALYSERLELAGQLEEHGRAFNKVWRRFLETEGRYRTLALELGLDAREFRPVAYTAAVCACLPGVVADIDIDVVRGEGPVGLVESRALDRLPRVRD